MQKKKKNFQKSKTKIEIQNVPAGCHTLFSTAVTKKTPNSRKREEHDNSCGMILRLRPMLAGIKKPQWGKSPRVLTFGCIIVSLGEVPSSATPGINHVCKKPRNTSRQLLWNFGACCSKPFQFSRSLPIFSISLKIYPYQSSPIVWRCPPPPQCLLRPFSLTGFWPIWVAQK